ncbi:rhomboid family intramembrane serine protease [Microbulbifer yueqingensis]|uniref:GlpG protein n=1 Tax=Microbulbifer yueqingensis TaxID=658219 RepID=A0A1G8YEL7_9GAMM|nr:rhomboid family intramembrane serine protease [Microbulbifer yueqingensis]SDK01288.1 GlpG protein [Microbulbifer yueqingensis]
MSDWIIVREFSPEQDLSELADFIRRCGLPARITEERDCQRLATPDPRLAELLRPLLDRWQAGELELAGVQVTAEPEAGAAAEAPAGEYEATVPGLPSWPLNRTPVSLVLIVLCFAGWFLAGGSFARELVIMPDRSADFTLARSTLAWHFSSGEYWRLWSPAILHFSLPHALFNALGIWILGRPLEARAGGAVFLLLVLVSAAAANLAQFWWSPQIIFGGMSGVVYALVGCVFILQRRHPDWREVPGGIVAVAVGWLLLCATGLVTLVLGVGVANAAHMGGFACGVLLAALYCLAGGDRHFANREGTA